jgi:hypothetical protein
MLSLQGDDLATVANLECVKGYTLAPEQEYAWKKAKRWINSLLIGQDSHDRRT